MWRIAARWIFACLFLLALTPSSTQAQPPSDVPYLYHYSTEDQAFIIERADGSDRRVLTQYSIPREDAVLADGSGFIVGPGWSPSGEWFVWSSLYRNSVPSLGTFIVNRNGSTPAQLTDGHVVNSMQWSPNEDLLLRWYWTENSEEAEQIIELYNPQEDQPIFTLSAKELFNSQKYIRQVGWAPDGQHILAVNDETLKILTLAGTDVVSFETTLVPYSGCEFGTLPHWLDEHRIAYLPSKTTHLIVENFETKEQEQIIELPSNAIRMIDWSPDHEYALVYTGPPQARSGYSLWLLSLSDGDIRLISDDVYFNVNCAILFDSTLWGNRDQVVFFSKDRQIQVLDASTRNTTPVKIPVNSEIDTVSPIRWTAAGEIVFLVRLIPPPGKHIYKYDVLSDELTLLAPSDPAGSVQTEYISTFQDDEFIYNGSIINVTSGIQREILRGSPKFGTLQFSAHHVKWHHSGDWLIAVSFSFEGLYEVYVSDKAGTTQRELGRCLRGSNSCYGWLPSDTSGQ
jgi:hypothetical protein